jgi:hypothetical protein
MKVIKIFIIVICIISCQTKNTNFDAEALKFKAFPIESVLTLDLYHKFENTYIEGVLYLNDSTLILRNDSNTSKFHFTSFNLNKKNSISDFLETGRQEHQSMAFLSYGILKDKVWVYDIIKNELITTQIDSSERETAEFYFDNSIPTFYYNIQPLTTDNYLGSGDYDSDYKISIIDFKTNDLIKQIDPYPIGISRGFKMAYESFLYINPSKTKVVMAGRFTDRVQITDLKTETSLVLKGPDNFEPDVDFTMQLDGNEISYRNKNTKYAFVGGKTTEKYIYLLYSGNNHESDFLNYGKSIFVYSWDGKPIKKIELPNYILDFAVTSDDSTIYTYNPYKQCLEIGKLN